MSRLNKRNLNKLVMWLHCLTFFYNFFRSKPKVWQYNGPKMFWRLNHIQMCSFTFAVLKKKNESGAKGETQQTVGWAWWLHQMQILSPRCVSPDKQGVLKTEHTMLAGIGKLGFFSFSTEVSRAKRSSGKFQRLCEGLFRRRKLWRSRGSDGSVLFHQEQRETYLI